VKQLLIQRLKSFHQDPCFTNEIIILAAKSAYDIRGFIQYQSYKKVCVFLLLTDSNPERFKMDLNTRI